MDLVELVSEENVMTGETADKHVAHSEGLWHRAAHIWVVTDDGKILLQKRGPQKKVYPNCWDTSAAGHIEVGESEINGALRELEEEVGIRCEAEELELLDVYKMNHKAGDLWIKEFYYVYLYNFSGTREDLVLQESELEAAEFFSIEDIEKKITEKSENIVPVWEYWNWALDKIKSSLSKNHEK